MVKKSILAAACAGSAIVLMSACGTATDDARTQPPATPAAGGQVELGARDTALGRVLTDGDGFTLYRFDEDTADTIRCTGPCAQIWPPSLGAPDPEATLAARADVTTRPDGTEQTTYDGHPLYRFAKDTAPGQTSGDGVKGTWHVVTVDSAHG
ncbi:hypothetical protein [Rhodococcus jostii]|uniref:Predicted lipoprotein with conserved Yx(FWY)xxD motif n=1 Tax=Rhodococcus jostii TaxID=132919 RepID=A0A1H5F611_RHOJO|nr:hypothetical protein [Rhodococcus jostii]SED98664.1 Predicted lipoprotein with conserved Yx(FWY)xxD motif [Rhodococcus jostii]